MDQQQILNEQRPQPPPKSPLVLRKQNKDENEPPKRVSDRISLFEIDEHKSVDATQITNKQKRTSEPLLRPPKSPLCQRKQEKIPSDQQNTSKVQIPVYEETKDVKGKRKSQNLDQLIFKLEKQSDGQKSDKRDFEKDPEDKTQQITPPQPAPRPPKSPSLQRKQDNPDNDKQTKLTGKIPGIVKSTVSSIANNLQKKDRKQEAKNPDTTINDCSTVPGKDNSRDINSPITRSVMVERNNLCSTDLVAKISAGMILKGRVCSGTLSEYKLSLRPLLEFKSSEQIKLLLSQIPEEMQVILFNDQKSSLEFESKLKTFGISAALKCRYELSKAGTGINYKKDNQSYTAENDKYQISKVYQILNVPTAAFSLANLNIKLANGALEALYLLDKQVEDATFNVKCQTFFKIFGSHYFAGLYHFGGRYEWIATCESEASESKQENKKMAKLALNGSLSAGMGWVSGKVSAAFDRTKDKDIIEQSISENFTISKQLLKHGGPQEVDNHIQWKEGLVRYKKTWHVIEMDTTDDVSFIGVWELVKETESITNRDKLSKKMEQVWKDKYKHYKQVAVND